MIDSCRLPCRIRVYGVENREGRRNGQKRRGERRDGYESRQIRAKRATELQKDNVRAAFLSPLRRSPPKSLGPVKRFRVTSRNFFLFALSSAQVP